MIRQELKEAYINEAMSLVNDEAMMQQALRALRSIKMQRSQNALQLYNRRVGRTARTIGGLYSCRENLYDGGIT